MRTKSQSVTVQSASNQTTQEVDYEKCVYSCTILRKKFLGVSSRYLYLFADQIAICKVGMIE